MTELRRDNFSNNYVGVLVPTEGGWLVVPPTCCPDGHGYGEAGWSVNSLWRTCNGRYGAALLVREMHLCASAWC